MTLLKRGSHGFDVRLVQSTLIGLGLLSGWPTGAFDERTYKAVRSYQKLHGLKVDGIVGPITRGVLFPGEAARESQERAFSSSFTDTLLRVAAKYEYVSETHGNNRSPEIDRWLEELELPPGLPWCLAYQQGNFREAAQIHGVPDPLKPNTAHCLTLWNSVPKSWRHGPTEGRRGDLGIMDFGKGNGHVYLVESYKGGIYTTWEGNTNDDGSREGNKVAHKETRKYSDPKLLGFIRVPDPL